ncbi:exodeoxyribonuclease V subunit alpha [Thalassotalea ganghwensis]
MVNTLAVSSNPLPYSYFEQASTQLYGISAIDYFLAKELTELLVNTTADDKVESEAQISEKTFHLVVTLSMAMRQGHSCLSLKEVATQRVGFMAQANGIVSHQGYQLPTLVELTALLENLAIRPEAGKPLVYANDNLYLRRYYLFEQEVRSYVNNSKSDQQLENTIEVKQHLSTLFSNESEELDWQHLAVANAINKRFSIIAGGPGTGKTYTVTKLLAAIISLSFNKSLTIALVAPTGKAAQRLSESLVKAIKGFEGQIDASILAQIPTNAQTIHRLLGVIPYQVNFRHHQENLLSIDVLIVDEVSMVDLPMMARIIRALPTHTQLIMLGDADQLPSVAVGSILADLAPRPFKGFTKANRDYLQEVTGYEQIPVSKSGQDHVTFLQKSRRFDDKGLVGQLATLVIESQAALSWSLLEQHNVVYSPESFTWLEAIVKQYYAPLLSVKSLDEAFNILNQFRILSATRVGEFGVEKLNERVELILQGKSYAEQVYHGKPIMVTENDYSLDLYNGDIGIVWRQENGSFKVFFERQHGEYYGVLLSRLPRYQTVYAMTIHKTQGSEFSHLVMVLPIRNENNMLSRELLYTGITRAKQSLKVVSSKAIWCNAVEARVKRNSGL